MSKRRLRSLVSIVVVLMAAAYTWWDSRSGPPNTLPPVVTTTIEAESSPDPLSTHPDSERKSEALDMDLSSVAAPEQEQLRATVSLIDAGGPFPYRKDGTTFRNAEKKLPRESGSYYREYTVRTPGSRDRGARRIVAGKRGELYYTNDHYRSFVRIRDQLRD